MATIFENQGIIDPYAITTLGVHAKVRPGAIGIFGTGIKYAICVILRLGGSIRILSDDNEYIFTCKTVVVRGERFDIVQMNGADLGFTTDLGKTWEPWMAYRELWSNARDEGGTVYELSADEIPITPKDMTRIVVDCNEISTAHTMSPTFLISENRRPMFTVSGKIEVYEGSSRFVFYRGIRAGVVPSGKRSRYTYNILTEVDLTEDRTIKYQHEINRAIEEAVLLSDNAKYVEDVITESEEGVTESAIDFFWTSHQTPSQTYMTVMEETKRKRAGDINDAALKKMKKHTPKAAAPDGRPFNAKERAMLDYAMSFTKSIGFPCEEHTIRLAESLGEQTLAIALLKENTMVLSAECFRRGPRCVAAALIEEHLHLVTQQNDGSRGFQTAMLDHIVRLGEELSGNALDDVRAA